MLLSHTREAEFVAAGLEIGARKLMRTTGGKIVEVDVFECDTPADCSDVQSDVQSNRKSGVYLSVICFSWSDRVCLAGRPGTTRTA